jgi:arylsulfatase A-like enzyme
MPTLQAQLHRRAYYAAVSQTDRHIGSLLAHLDQVGESETTAVIVFGEYVVVIFSSCQEARPA